MIRGGICKKDLDSPLNAGDGMYIHEMAVYYYIRTIKGVCHIRL